MRVGIVGVGGVGGYYGAKLQAAGHEVCFITHGAHAKALREKGLRVISQTGDVCLPQVEVYEDPREAPKVDVALSCVKLYDAKNAAHTIKEIVQPNGVAISLQNGIDGPELLRSALPDTQVLAGSVIISAFIETPGVIRHIDTNQFIHIEKRGMQSDAFVQACEQAGFNAKLVEDPDELLWKKFVRLVPLSGIATLARSAFGTICANAHLLDVLSALVEETVAVGRAKGVSLPDTIVDDIRARVGGVPEFKPSLLLDLERGRRLEAPWLAGRVVELGRQLKVATPYNDCVWAALLPYCEGAEGATQ